MFFFLLYCHHPYLHVLPLSFPTLRSSYLLLSSPCRLSVRRCWPRGGPDAARSDASQVGATPPTPTRACIGCVAPTHGKRVTAARAGPGAATLARARW